DQADFAATGGNAVDAVKLDLLERRRVALGEAVGRIGEVDFPVAADRDIVAAAEALAEIFVGNDRLLLRLEIDAGDRAGAAVRHDQIAVRVDRKTVRPRFAHAIGNRAGQPRGIE